MAMGSKYPTGIGSNGYRRVN
eukprot:SAG31_NODE_11930_length_985_cov_0.819413_1_plen_20_part_01